LPRFPRVARPKADHDGGIFSWNEAPGYVIRDRDRIYGGILTRRLRAMGIRDKPTAPGSPWQNGLAERLIGSIRRECLDYVVVFGVRFRRQEAVDKMWSWERQGNDWKAALNGCSQPESSRQTRAHLCAARAIPRPKTKESAAVLGLHGSACTVWRKVKMVQSVSSSSSPAQLGMPLSGRPCVTVKWNRLAMFSP
jgi:Integrase core domain